MSGIAIASTDERAFRKIVKTASTFRPEIAGRG